MKRLFFTLLLLAGCATESRFDKAMTPYVGKPADALLLKYGMPARTRPNDNGTRTLTWEDKWEIGGLYGTHYLECVLNVNVAQDGTVAGYERRGNGCKN